MGRKERERRYISEYMLKTYPDGDYEINVELGAIPADYVQRYGQTKAAALFRPTRPRVDAVKWTPQAYYLIEAKIRDVKAGIGDLMYYGAVIPVTPDLPFYTGQPIVKQLVIPWMLDWLQPVADNAGVEVVVYHTDWIEDYVRERQHYFTAEYREERAKKIKLREILDVD